MRRVTLSATWLALALLAVQASAAPPAQALEMRGGDVVTIPADTTINDDLAVTGQSITIAGHVTGDVYAFGSNVTVTGTVDRDLIAAAQRITIDGVVNGVAAVEPIEIVAMTLFWK